MPAPLHVTFVAASSGPWLIERSVAVSGEGLAPAPRLAVSEGLATSAVDRVWALRGTTSHARYATRGEVDLLSGRQQGLRRPEATCAALIPIRKSESWWGLAQDERRRIFEDRSRHIAIGAEYLPAVARRLHHSRELGEPFDFLTWFEFAPQHAAAFDAMLIRLRASEEWRHVEREVEIRLTLDDM